MGKGLEGPKSHDSRGAPSSLSCARVELQGSMPLLDLKASWFISDHMDPAHGTTLLVPGSFRWTAQQRATWQQVPLPSLLPSPAGGIAAAQLTS